MHRVSTINKNEMIEPKHAKMAIAAIVGVFLTSRLSQYLTSLPAFVQVLVILIIFLLLYTIVQKLLEKL